MARLKMPKVGDFVQVVYYGVVTEVRNGPDFLPQFELEGSNTRHAMGEVSGVTVYDEPAVDPLMNSFARVNRDF